MAQRTVTNAVFSRRVNNDFGTGSELSDAIERPAVRHGSGHVNRQCERSGQRARSCINRRNREGLNGKSAWGMTAVIDRHQSYLRFSNVLLNPLR